MDVVYGGSFRRGASARKSSEECEAGEKGELDGFGVTDVEVGGDVKHFERINDIKG